MQFWEKSLPFWCIWCIWAVAALESRYYVYDSSEWRAVAEASFNIRDDPLETLEPAMNYGAGPAVNVSLGEFHTDQYQLYAMIYHRALRDMRRTLDPNEATTFIIPYDFATDSAYYKQCQKSAGRCYDFRKCPLAPTVEELLHKSEYFVRSNGRDHLLIIGMNYAMDHYILKPKCKSLLLTCSNCTKVAIDDYSFLHSDDSGIVEKGDYWHAIPFPSDFHWTRDVVPPFPWMNDNRPILSSYIGSTKSYYNPARRLRGSIVHFCELHAYPMCEHATYGKNGTRDSFKVEGYDPLSISAKSIFCFQPIGDLMTRKGLFDSLIQGCIPVIFDVLTANVMYTWHWSESFWNDISVQFLFHPTAFRYFDPVLALQDLYVNNTAEVKRKQQLIRERVFELQYGLEGRVERNGPLQKRPWTNGKSAAPNVDTWPVDSNGIPMRDAFDITIDHVLAIHSGKETHNRNATIPECWNGTLDKEKNKCVPNKKAENR